MRPTEEAKLNFDQVKMNAGFARTRALEDGDQYKIDIAIILDSMGSGLTAMATGLRATYLKLEEIERKIDRLQR